MGSGGAGKLIFDCRSSLSSNSSCITVDLDEIKINIDTGDFNSKIQAN